MNLKKKNPSFLGLDSDNVLAYVTEETPRGNYNISYVAKEDGLGWHSDSP